MLVVRCKVCNKELTGHETQSKCCGCSNMTTVTGEVVTAVDLSKVIMVQASEKKSKKQSSTSIEFPPKDLGIIPYLS